MLAELDKLSVLTAIHPSLSWPYPDGKMGPAESDPLTREARRDTYLAILASEFAGVPEQGEALARSLRLPASDIKLMRDSARLAAIWPQLGEDGLKPSEIYHLLHPLALAALQAYTRIRPLSQDTVAWSRLHDYLNRLRHVKPTLTGEYLREHGVPSGPIYKHLLKDLLNAKLNGELPEREDEERFVKDWLTKGQN
jgi:tRNA nucleotidyltransferase (CCA-adding enzyme)